MRQFLAFSCVLVPIFIAFLLEQNGSYSSQVLFGSAVLAAAVLLWLSELIPLPATALLIPVLIVFLGLQTTAEAFRPFSSSIIFLFIGAFFLAKAMQKHGWDQRLAFLILSSRIGARSVLGLFVAVGGVAFVLSMWISNTATCAMMCPIVIGIANVIEKEEPAAKGSNLRISLLLMVAYASSVGGIATPVGTPPNLITLGLLKERGFEIDFLSWMQFATPIAVVMFVALLLVMIALFPVREVQAAQFFRLKKHFKNLLRDLGPLKREELWVAACFFAAVFFWVLPGIVSAVNPEGVAAEWLKAHLPMSVVALAAGLLLFFLPSGKDQRILKWADAKEIDWGTVILFGGGLSLGKMLQETGIAQIIGEGVFHLAANNPAALVFFAALLGLSFTEVASNTATASVFVAVLLGIVPTDASISEYAPVFAACLATSYSFMLPVATPPNAIVFGTGEVKLRKMLRAGLVMNLVGLVILYAAIQWFGLHHFLK